MQRDMDLIRKVLLAMEEREGSPSFEQLWKDYRRDQVSFHMALMVESPLGKGEVKRLAATACGKH